MWETPSLAETSRRLDPESAVEPLRSLLRWLPRIFPGEQMVKYRAHELDRLLDEWVDDHRTEEPNRPTPQSMSDVVPKHTDAGPSLGRSLFDDLLDGSGVGVSAGVAGQLLASCYRNLVT